MSEYNDSRAMASAERAYLTPPEDSYPAAVEDVIHSIIRWPEGDDEDSRFPEFGRVTEAEAWEDEDEGGKHGGYTLTVERVLIDPPDCRECGGVGRITQVLIGQQRSSLDDRACSRCNGTGKQLADETTIELDKLEEYAVEPELRAVVKAWSEQAHHEYRARAEKRKATYLRCKWAQERQGEVTR